STWYCPRQHPIKAALAAKKGVRAIACDLKTDVGHGAPIEGGHGGVTFPRWSTRGNRMCISDFRDQSSRAGPTEVPSRSSRCQRSESVRPAINVRWPLSVPAGHVLDCVRQQSCIGLVAHDRTNLLQFDFASRIAQPADDLRCLRRTIFPKRTIQRPTAV